MPARSSTLDPARAWEPAPPEQWNRKWAAHLYRRAAFGFPPGAVATETPAWQALQQAVDRGPDAAVDELLAGGPEQSRYNELMDSLGERIAGSVGRASPFGQTLETDKLQGWWLYRMLHAPHPLLERMTLFWHDHFATSIAKVGKATWMFRQNRLLRRHALGQFRPLLHGISRDPAMLDWLDADSNIKGRPNENFAREIMELFSLGVGHYTEADIREAARAFTGWSIADGEFYFNESLHDDGEKTVLGRTGRWTGDDVVDILLEQPATARFLIRKLYRLFISESESPSEALIEPLADRFRQSGYDIRDCVGTILRSRLFFSEQAYRQRVKSPVEYTIGLLQSFDTSVPMQQLAQAMDGLGQSLFAPPTVKGWDGGRNWLNSATLLARHNLAAKLLLGGEEDTELSRSIDPLPLVQEFAADDPAARAEFLLNMLLQGDISQQARSKLLRFATRKTTEDESEEDRLRQVTHMIVLMPEYQVA